MFALLKPVARMIEPIRRLEVEYGLKIIVVRNESRELNTHRIGMFKLAIGAGSRPDNRTPECLSRKHRAVRPDRQGMGIRSILHTDYPFTRAELADLELKI
jgi:hypothetical protein